MRAGTAICRRHGSAIVHPDRLMGHHVSPVATPLPNFILTTIMPLAHFVGGFVADVIPAMGFRAAPANLSPD